MVTAWDGAKQRYTVFFDEISQPLAIKAANLTDVGPPPAGGASAAVAPTVSGNNVQMSCVIPEGKTGGDKLTLALPSGHKVSVTIPAHSKPGTTLRAEGKGAPKLNNVNVRGSHYVKVKVEIPQKLSNKERDLVTQLKEVTK